MKIKFKVALSVTLILMLIGASIWRCFNSDSKETKIATENKVETAEPEVEVKINKNIEVPKVYEKITTDNGEEVIAEVQENAPPAKRNDPPKEKPKATGSYTNPEASPTYSKEQTVIEEKPKTSVSQRETSEAASSGSKVYVEGFGYITQGGSTKTTTGQSTGDINKMVGSMD